jgi:competence protein ComEC
MMKILSLAVVSVWLAVLSYNSNFRLIACNVGQGDATLVAYGTIQILIDGGPDNKVLTCLSKYMPFWDKQLELVILTHPDADHYRGLVDVFKTYKIDNFISTREQSVLQNPVGSRMIIADNQKIRVGLISLELFDNPTGDDNERSVVTELKYRNFKALLTGDAPATILQKFNLEPVNYLKVPHHGSKTGLTQALLEIIQPKMAVISVGKNSYGHPTPEIIKLLQDNKIKIYRTDLMGDIIIP